ncbi:hypothetical protein C8N43_2667 [Litoreibacter ponti]|uniref:DUF2975 family protein n=2 Tax=Litoreibacter ponti TaxID=1510457 RepID=A0A2T6BPL2_9RHOB|nr:hypothetical protein C8N43_2667 [Litoreibacter ponti]
MPEVARVLTVVTLAAMIAIVIFVAYSFIDTSLAKAMVLRQALSFPLDDASEGTLRMMMGIGLVAMLVQLYILNSVRDLFGLYARGIFLTDDNGHAITRIGLGLITLPLVRFILEPLWTLLLTHGLDERSVSISVSSTGIGLMLGGILMLMIGRSMSEAVRLRLENEAFV